MALRDFLKKPANSVAPDRSSFGDQYDIKIDTLFDSLVASFDYIEANYGGSGGSPPTGPANGDLAGTYPNPTLKTTGVTATSYPTTGTIPTFTVDAKGRLTVAGFTADGSNINVSAANLTGTVPESHGGFGQNVSLLSTGFISRTAANTYAVRSLTAPAAGLTISNPAGTAGDPTFSLANDLAALEGLSTAGFSCRTATDTWAIRTLTAGNGIGITNPAGTAGNPTVSVTYGTLVNTSTQGNDNRLNPAPGTAGRIPYDTVTGYALLPASTSNRVLHSGPTPSWSAVSLTTDVSGVLPLSNLPGNGQVSVYPNFPLTGGGTMSLGGSVSIECPDFFAPVTLAALSNFGFWAGEQYVGPSYDASSNANLMGYFSCGWHRVQRKGVYQIFKMTNSEAPPFDVPIQIWQAHDGDPLGFFFTGLTIVMPKSGYITTLADKLEVREDDLIVCYNPDIALGYYCGPMTIQAELKIS
jgi:hypothetical protein